MILIVGGVGLVINLVGMLIFGHGHSHHDEETGGHSHSSHCHQPGRTEVDRQGVGGGGGDGDGRCQDKEETVTSGDQLNIHGVFLHVMADALGSVVVLISASVIWLTDWQYKDYLDPLLSLVIVLLVSLSSWPLLRQSVLILLNSIPGQ